MRGTSEDLGRLASLYGVQTSFTDVDGVVRQADPAVVVALLRALGLPLDRAGDAAALARQRMSALLERRLEPVVVHRIGRQEPVSATLRHESELRSSWLALELEDGTTNRCELVSAITGYERGPGNVQQVRVQLDLDAISESPVPPGYHRLSLEWSDGVESARVLAAPNCPCGPRQWAAFLPLHALRTEEDWGVGTYPDLARLAGWVSSLGGGLVGTLPLYPAYLEPPGDPSPYLPVSRLAYNELFVDLTALPEYRETIDERTGGDLAGRLVPLRSSAAVEYEEIAALKRPLLEALAEVVHSGRYPDRRQGLDAFAVAHPELVAYAHFRAEQERPSPGADPDPSVARYHLYAQWVAWEQLAAAGASGGLYADFPVGSHPRGFDPVWAPDSFVPGVEGGAPPDRFFEGGQSWGFQPLHPEHMREDGYRFFSAALRRAFRHARCLRIDHVMGLQRMYMIPTGNEATDGAYVSYRAEELHALVALEAYRAGAVVVGEDLGTVPDGVRRRMAADRMLRTWVFEFESTPEQPLPSPPQHVLASLGTHDLPRFAAYLWGEDIAEREDNGALSAAGAAEERRTRATWRRTLLDGLRLSPAETSVEQLTAAAYEGCVHHLATSAAQIVMVDIEETWDERRPQNHPGTESNANWRLRGRRTFEEFSTDPALVRLLSRLSAERVS